MGSNDWSTTMNRRDTRSHYWLLVKKNESGMLTLYENGKWGMGLNSTTKYRDVGGVTQLVTFDKPDNQYARENHPEADGWWKIERSVDELGLINLNIAEYRKVTR